MMLSDVIHERFRQAGWREKIVSIEHLSDLQKEIEEHRLKRRLDDVLFAEYLARFDFGIRSAFPNMKSVIIVTAPQFQTRVTFKWNGKTHACIIPPTYYLATDDQIQESLEKILIPEGYCLKKIRLPQKILAVNSGLAKYGKNNLSHVPGMGSFHRPVVFATDMACSKDSWGEPTQMKTCENCTACMDACPAGVIGSHRFLVHAERCITFHNERRPEFPEWLDPAWHNCWVGCMLCQIVCPVNHKFLNRMDDGEAFSEKETEYLLKNTPPNNAPKSLTQKIKKLGLAEYAGVLGRNLKAILENPSGISESMKGP
jgi:epoxyqueuosine reductase